MHSLSLNCLKYTSKELGVTVQVNVRLNCSFLNVMSLQACTYDSCCLQGFLAVPFLKLCSNTVFLLSCVNSDVLNQMFPVCAFELFSMCNDVSTCAVYVL